MSFVRAVAAVLALVVASACSSGSVRPPGPLRIVATTSTLASLARGATGGAEVRSLVPVGVSPEDYQPTPADIAALHDADVLVENGAGLELWLEGTIRNAGNRTTKRKICIRRRPNARAASIWPNGIASMPPRTISVA